MLPVLNMEETIGKTVGRRRGSFRSRDYGLALQRTLGQLLRPKVTKGVYRFRSHEEADQWLTDHLTRKPGN